jgi:hypothetical protein
MQETLVNEMLNFGDIQITKSGIFSTTQKKKLTETERIV